MHSSWPHEQPVKMRGIDRHTGTLKVVGSGLHIGAGKEFSEPGATDATVIKNPVTGLPYIPGSSVKGKIRSLLEHAKGYDPPERRGEKDWGFLVAVGTQSAMCASCSVARMRGRVGFPRAWCSGTHNLPLRP